MLLKNHKNSFSILALLLLLSSFTEAAAQIVNIEEARVKGDSSNFLAGKIGLDFSLYNQNAGKGNPNNFLQLTFNGDLAYFSEKHTYMLFNYANYLLVNFTSESERNTVASNGYTHFRINLFRDRKLSYELFAQAQADKARGLELRTLSGGYLRLNVMQKSEKVQLFVGTGLMHEHEEWEVPDQEDKVRISDLLKSTNYVSGKAKLNDQVETSGIVYYQFGYDRSIERMRNRVSGNLTVNVKLYKALSLNTSFDCTYEDRPIVPVTKFVYAISNGLVLAF